MFLSLQIYINKWNNSQHGPINIQDIYGGPTICQVVFYALGNMAVKCQVNCPKIISGCVILLLKNCQRFVLIIT